MPISSFNFPSLALLFFLTVVLRGTLASEASFSFSFEGFGKNRSDVSLHGDAEVRDSVARITRSANSSSGNMVYRKPIKFLGRNPGFSTAFTFSVSPGNEGSLVFWVSPVTLMKGVSHDLASPSVVLVEFSSSAKSRVGIDLAGQVSVENSNLSTVLNRGSKLICWVEYDGKFKKLEVRLGNSTSSRPSSSLISYSIDLLNLLWRTPMLVGITSSSRNSTICVYSWSFATKHGAPYKMHSDPLDPHLFPSVPHERPTIAVRRGYPWIILVALVFGAACGAMVAFFVTFICSTIICRRPIAPAEYPVHPVDLGYEKVVLVQGKGVKSSNM